MDICLRKRLWPEAKSTATSRPTGRPRIDAGRYNARYNEGLASVPDRKKGEGEEREREEKRGNRRCHRVLGWCFLSETNRVISVFYGRIRTWILYTGGLQVWLGCSWIFQEQWMRTLPARWFLSPRLKDLGLFDCVGGWLLDRRRDWNLE